MKTILKRDDLLHDISNLAYVIADVSEGKESPHTLHQIYDICEEGNIERVNSLLIMAAAEVGAAIAPVGSLRVRSDKYILIITLLPHSSVRKLTELVREYFVASVLYGWLSVTLPKSAPFWASRMKEIMESLGSVAGSRLTAFSRKVPPI